MCYLSIIIVNTGTRDLTCQCLESIYSSSPSCEFEVIVVDNASTDGSCETIELHYPKVRLIRSNQNLGFCRANNLGFEAATGEHYMLLNNDTIVLPGSLDKLLMALKEDITVGIVAPKLVYPDGSLQMSYGAMPGLFVSFCSFFDLKKMISPFLMSKIGRVHVAQILGKNTASYVEWSSPTQPETRKLPKHLLVTGACMLIRGNCFKEVGALDPNFFMYVDDADYCKRVHDASWDIKYVAEAVIIHIKGGTVGQRYRWKSAAAYHSVFYFLVKHRGWGTAQIAKAMAICSLLVRALAKELLGSSLARDEWKLLRCVAEWRAKKPDFSTRTETMRLEAGSGNAAN